MQIAHTKPPSTAPKSLLHRTRPVSTTFRLHTYQCTRGNARLRGVTAGAAAAGGGASTAADAAATADDAWRLLSAYTAAEARGGPAGAQAFLGDAARRASLRSALMAAYTAPRPDAGWFPQASAEQQQQQQQQPDQQQPQSQQQDQPAAAAAGTPVLLGVVARDARLALRALRDWTGALGLPYAAPECRIAGVAGLAAVEGGVYVKYNAQGPACYASAYAGRDTGVLLQLGAAQFGHFPLGLWDEQKAAAPPPPPDGGAV